MTDPYENIPGRHRHGRAWDQREEQIERDYRLLRRVIYRRMAFWAALVGLAYWWMH